jgi:hypothetical protein
VIYDDLPEEVDRHFPPIEQFLVPQEVRTYISNGWAKTDSFLRSKIAAELTRIKDPFVKVLFLVEELTRVQCNHGNHQAPQR